MSYRFQIPVCPYDENERLYDRKNIEIDEGVTVLVGCNGAGKTTLRRLMSDQLSRDKIPYINFDQITQGKTHCIDEAIHIKNDVSLAASAVSLSEGEGIQFAFGQFLKKLGKHVAKGKDTGKMFLFVDAIDSGASIDHIVEFREFFDWLVERERGLELYIIITANTYEMARDSKCFDVKAGKYIRFADYEEYRAFVLESRKMKDERLRSNT